MPGWTAPVGMVGITTLLALFADVPNNGDSVVSGAVGTIVGGGFSLWLARHLITNVIPRMQDEHARALAAQDALHAATIREMQTDFKSELQGIWNNHRTDMTQLWTESKETSRLMVDAIQNLTMELRQVDRSITRSSDSAILGARPSGIMVEAPRAGENR